MYLTCMSFRLCEFISYYSSILSFYKCNRKSASSSEKGRRKLPFCFSPADMKTKSIMKHMARLPLHRHPHVDLVECQSDLKKNKNDWTPKKGFSSPPLQELSSGSGLDSATRWKLTDMTVSLLKVIRCYGEFIWSQGFSTFGFVEIQLGIFLGTWCTIPW